MYPTVAAEEFLTMVNKPKKLPEEDEVKAVWETYANENQILIEKQGSKAPTKAKIVEACKEYYSKAYDEWIEAEKLKGPPEPAKEPDEMESLIAELNSRKRVFARPSIAWPVRRSSAG